MLQPEGLTPTALSTMAARYVVVAGLFPSALAIVPNKSAPPHATLLPPILLAVMNVQVVEPKTQVPRRNTKMKFIPNKLLSPK